MRVGRERDARNEDIDMPTVPEEELELAGETLSRLDTQIDKANDYQEHVLFGGLCDCGSTTANLTVDETWQDEEMPLASLAPAAGILVLWRLEIWRYGDLEVRGWRYGDWKLAWARARARLESSYYGGWRNCPLRRRRSQSASDQQRKTRRRELARVEC
jgi:hypothetical protein